MGRRVGAADDTTACERAGTVLLTSAELEKLIPLREVGMPLHKAISAVV